MSEKRDIQCIFVRMYIYVYTYGVCVCVCVCVKLVHLCVAT
jgi:hypothetical protein